MARVLIAPDSFKGTLPADQVAAALAEGWRSVRPQDRLRLLPVADGGEGTLDALEAAGVGVRRQTTAPWLELPDQVGVVELAACCGLTLLERPDPLHAGTEALGDLLSEVLDAGMERIIVGLGGSGSTDGGTGALRALGARFLDGAGDELAPGGAALAELASIDTGTLRAAPPLELLTDVTNPLCGPRGAAAVFAPQKGATPADVELLEEAMRRLRDVVGDPDRAGAGAAGGTAYGLATLWGGAITSGADRVLELTGFSAALAEADLVVTGEGRFDAQSLGGKLVGTVLTRAAGSVPALVVAGSVDPAVASDVAHQSLVDLAGGLDAALADPARWLREAGRRAAAAWLG